MNGKLYVVSCVVTAAEALVKRLEPEFLGEARKTGVKRSSQDVWGEREKERESKQAESKEDKDVDSASLSTAFVKT